MAWTVPKLSSPCQLLTNQTLWSGAAGERTSDVGWGRERVQGPGMQVGPPEPLNLVLNPLVLLAKHHWK